MKKFDRLLKGHKNIVFLDFEGTQFSHEMIAIGAVSCSLDRNGRIKKSKKPFKILVKAKNKVGKYVANLTGITDEMLAKDGVSFGKALDALKKYVGIPFKKSSFVTFGSHDLTILNRSISYNFDFKKEICSQIQKNYIDFLAFIGEFIKDPKGNQISLVHFCQMFKVEEAGKAHDPSVDAVNLANLYDAFVSNKDLVLEEYKKVLGKFSHFPEPVNKVVQKLVAGESVSPEDFEQEIKKYID